MTWIINKKPRITSDNFKVGDEVYILFNKFTYDVIEIDKIYLKLKALYFKDPFRVEIISVQKSVCKHAKSPKI